VKLPDLIVLPPLTTMAAELVEQQAAPGERFRLPPELIAPKTGPPSLTGVSMPDDFAEALEKLPMESAPCEEEPPVVGKVMEPFRVSGIPPGDAMAETPY
jgi:hypothetical protein